MIKIVLLGASGTIGQQTVDIVSQHQDDYELVSVSVGHNIDYLEKLLASFSSIKEVCVAEKEDHEALKADHPGINFYYGNEGLIEITSTSQEVLVVNALQGFVGLLPSLNAMNHQHNLALANKETLVAAGEIMLDTAKKNDVTIIPIDSEHSAIMQCLAGSNSKEIKRLIITASGGSLRDLKRSELTGVTVEMALNHPNWHMGKKITIDSCTMMNKGFEVIEAHWLFNVDYDHIDTILHKESVVHSLVEFVDHSLMTQLAVSYMR